MPMTLRIHEILKLLDDTLNYTLDQLNSITTPPLATVNDGKYNPWAQENINIDYPALLRTMTLMQTVMTRYGTVIATVPLPHPQLRRYQPPWPPEAVNVPLPSNWAQIRPSFT